MKIFGKDLDEIKSWIRPPDPFLEEIKNRDKVDHGKVVVVGDNQRPAPLRDIDFRPIKGFGDIFPPEVYEGAKNKFPTLYDDYSKSARKWRDLVTKWKPQSEVMYVQYGQHGCFALASLTAGYITHHFRRCLRLQHKARLSMYVSNLFYAALFAGGINGEFVTKRVLRGNECLICNGLFSAVAQSSVSVILPVISSSIHGTFFAQRYFTVSSLPHQFFTFKEGRRQALKVVGEIIMKRGGIKVFAVLFMVNSLIGYHIGYIEGDETIGLYYNVLVQEYERQQRKKAKEQFDKANHGAATVGQVIDPSNVMVDSN